MLNSAAIVFREVLEAALIISIVLAATRGVTNRSYWIVGGVLAGMVGSVVVANITDQIAIAFEGIGQELFNIFILLAAVVMLAWHNIWMAKHAHELTVYMKKVAKDVASGSLPMYFLATAVGLAVLREGSEIVLFMYGLAASGSEHSSIFLGAVSGVALGALFGFLLYKGLLVIPVKNIFTATGLMILFLASGMAANAAMFLSQAGWLPSQRPLWDTSFLMSEQSIIGQFFHVFVGYQDSPTMIELCFYLTTFTLISAGMFWAKQSVKQRIVQ